MPAPPPSHRIRPSGRRDSRRDRDAVLSRAAQEERRGALRERRDRERRVDAQRRRDRRRIGHEDPGVPAQLVAVVERGRRRVVPDAARRQGVRAVRVLGAPVHGRCCPRPSRSRDELVADPAGQGEALPPHPRPVRLRLAPEAARPPLTARAKHPSRPGRERVAPHHARPPCRGCRSQRGATTPRAGEPRAAREEVTCRACGRGRRTPGRRRAGPLAALASPAAA